MILPGVIASSGGVASSFESIATTTVGSGGTATITFSSIATSWSHLQIRITAKTNYVNWYDGFKITLNNDSTNNYSWHYLAGSGSAASASATTSTANMSGNFIAGDQFASIFGAGIVDILDYTSTNKNKTIRTLSGSDENGQGYVQLASGLWFATPAAVNRVDIVPASGSLFKQYSSFALYGVKA